MTRKKKEYPIIENVTIVDTAAEGKAIAKVNDMVVFVPFVVPGDVVDLRILKKKHSYCEAVVVRFRQYSKRREQPFCPHFGVCGGCKWQILPYDDQLKQKQRQVADALKRIGKVEASGMHPILGAYHTKEYRNKLEFGFSNKRWLTTDEITSNTTYAPVGALGFHAPGSFDKVLPIIECHLMDDINNSIRNSVAAYAAEHNLSFYDQRLHIGLLRNLMIRTTNAGGLMLLFQFCITDSREQQQADDLMNYVAESFHQVTSLLYVNNTKWNDSVADLDIRTFKGTDHIYLQMGPLKFRVGPKSFYQTNTEQAELLYKVVRAFASLTGREIVYDLYTGTGTIACFLSGKARQVVGIEYVPEAIEDAKRNARINNIRNAYFFAGDIKDVLTDSLVKRIGKPDVIVTDPPRAGMHPDVIKAIIRIAPQRIVYVSCNPATQARDLALLNGNYRITAVQPVDMFPHTQHVENVVRLERRVLEDA